MKLLLTFFIWGVLFLTPAAAQFYPAAASNDTANYPYWYRMMQDPDISFYATQSAFYKYWAGRSNYRHNGWKVFKRWEYLQQNRLGTNGKPLKTQEMLDEYNRYMKSDRPFSPGGNWIELGPKTMPDNLTSQPNGMGRVNAVAFHPVNADIIFAGAASGGLWKSVNNGSTWTLIAGLLPAMGVSSILVHPAIPDTILIGTGDRDGDNSQGVGVYRSVDGGLNWAPSNTGMGKVTVGMMIRHPSDNNVILAATHKGIFKSINGGATWTLKSENTGEYKDIRFKPANPSIVYATENGNFYRSSDTGETWDLITTGIISGSRMVIGVSPNAHGKVYLCQTNGPFAGLLSSSDSGLTFTARSTKPNLMGYACDGSDTTESQANYDLCMAVDPNNAQTIYIGGVNVWKSIDGGVNWKINAHWIGSKYDTSASGGCHVPSIHADIHSLDWSPKNGKLYSGNDGGVYVADNGGLAWTDISSGLAISQIYKIGQSTKNPQLTIQGYQDNGTAITTQNAFATVVGGDGMQCIIDYADTNYRYAEEYDGKIKRSSGSWYYPITDSVNGIQEKGAWVTPFILDKAVPSRMFAGFRGVWRSVNIKTGNPKEIQWTKISSEVDTVCNVLEQSPANVRIIYVSRNYKGFSILKRTSNADAVNPTWTTIAAPDITPSSYVTDIKAHPTDSNIVYATFGKKVYKSIDRGDEWSDISGTLPALPVNCIVYDKNSNEGLYIGTLTGIYYRNAVLNDWILFSSGMPPVDIRDLAIYYDAQNPANNKIKAATYGRGLWQSDLYSSSLSLTVTPETRNVTAPAGTTTFTVTSTLSWLAGSNQEWCTVTPSGTGSGTLTADYTSNGTTVSRIASITVTAAGATPVTVTVSQAGLEVPENLTLEDITVTDGETNCYNALQTITIAGNDKAFLVESGGNVTLIAGQNIIFQAGTTVENGGYLMGQIASAGPWCQITSIPAILAGVDEIPVTDDHRMLRIHPNPTTGNFIIELAEENINDGVKIEIFGMRGESYLKAGIGGSRQHEFSLSTYPAGIYFIRVVSGEKAETVKIIKQ